MSRSDFEEYIRMTIKLDNKFSDLRKYAGENNIPIIRHLAQNVLETIITIRKPQKVLEIGTAIGYSAMIIYDAMNFYCKPIITTLEKDNTRFEEAKRNFKKFAYNINSINCDALDFLMTCNEKFDFIFLDGPKAQYIKYLPYILNILSDDGILFVDNLYQDGMISKSRYQILRRNRTIHKKMKEFIEEITRNERLKTSILSMSDGIAVSIKLK